MSRPWPTSPPTDDERAAVAAAAVGSFWLDGLPQRESHPPLSGLQRAELCIVGGGFSGLWAAIHAKSEQPDRDVVLLEGGSCARAASGRNGGFCSNSLTHGLANGYSHFRDELGQLDRLGRENLDGLLADLDRLAIDAHVQRVPDVLAALEAQQLEWLAEEAELYRAHGYQVELLDRAAAQSRIASPTYEGAMVTHGSGVLVDPGRLGEGLRRAAVELGVRIHEGSVVDGVAPSGDGRALRLIVRGRDPATPSRLGVRTRGRTAPGDATGRSRSPGGELLAERVVLATGSHRSHVGAVRHRVAPVYDYVLVTEQLSDAQWASLGWEDRAGVSDAANQFHYYRPTADGRILWGGYDAVHEFASAVHARRDQREASLLRLAQHFFTTFPQLRGLGFSHAWGGAIDTCSRLFPFFGTAFGGRAAYVAGYTGLGVGASRWGGRVALDLVDGRETASTRLQAVRKRPLPFPPEPLRSPAIALTQRALEQADASAGRRGPVLRTLGAFGIGFDS